MKYYILKGNYNYPDEHDDVIEFIKAFTTKKELQRYIKRERFSYKFLTMHLITEKLMWSNKGVKNV